MEFSVEALDSGVSFQLELATILMATRNNRSYRDIPNSDQYVFFSVFSADALFRNISST